MRINSYEVVLVFEIDETIVLSLGPALKNLQRNLGGQLVNINAPEGAPPNLPRIILKLDDSVLKLAIDRISISINPPSHVKSSAPKSSKFALKRARSIIDHLIPSTPKYKWCGVVAILEFPSKLSSYNSAIEAIEPVSNRLINIKRSGMDLATFQLQFGMKENFYFITYTLSGYETRDMKLIQKDKVGYVSIGPEDYIVTECGIRITLDINNKPGGTTEDPVKDIENILNKTNELSKSLIGDLNLEGILT